MNRKLFHFIAMVSLGAGSLLLTACQRVEVGNPVACTEEAKLCPDGSAVGRTGPDCSFVPCPKVEAPAVFPESPKPPVVAPKPSDGATDAKTEFGIAIVMRVGDAVSFPDGLSLTLREINDSRCPAGVQCIWAGELSPLFVATLKGVTTEVRLGMISQPKVDVGSHVFSLIGVSEVGATVTVFAD